MAMRILAGNQSRINTILNGSVCLINGIFMVLQYPIKILRQELMAGFDGFYNFNGVLIAS